MAIDRNFRYRTLEEPQDDLEADEAFLRNVVAPDPAPAAPAAPAPFNPVGFDWSKGMQNIDGTIYQPVFQESGSGETLEIGPLQHIMRYQLDNKPGDIYEFLDPTTGRVTSASKFTESKGFFGDLWSDISSVAADLGPVVQAVPFVGQAVQAINAINAARSGNVLPLVASAAGYGGYSDIANAARAAEAIRKDDYLGAVIPALQAAGISDVGGFNTKDINKAVNVARAIEKDNPLDLLGAASAYLPGPGMPGLFVDENIQEGFFDEGGPGYIKPTTAPYFPEFEEPMLTAESFGFTPMSAPERMAFLEANIEDPATVQQLMQQYYPELAAPVSASASGPRASGPAPAPAAAPGKAPAPAPAAQQSGMNLGALMAFMSALDQQQDAPDPYQVAQIRNPSPFGMDLIL